MKTIKIFLIFSIASLCYIDMHAMEQKTNDLEAQLLSTTQANPTLPSSLRSQQSTSPSPTRQQMQNPSSLNHGINRIFHNRPCPAWCYQQGNGDDGLAPGCCPRRTGPFDYENCCCKPICAVACTAALYACCWGLNKAYTD